MKIIHIITSLTVGGVERFLSNLLSSDLSKKTGNHVICLSDMAAFNELLKKIKQINPDIIQGWMYHDNLMASLGKILTRNNAVLVWNVRHSLLDLSSKGLNTQWVIKNSKWFSKQVNTVIYNTYFQLYKSLI